MSKEILFKVSDVARFMNVSRMTIYRYAQRGKLELITIKKTQYVSKRSLKSLFIGETLFDNVETITEENSAIVRQFSQYGKVCPEIANCQKGIDEKGNDFVSRCFTRRVLHEKCGVSLSEKQEPKGFVVYRISDVAKFINVSPATARSYVYQSFLEGVYVSGKTYVSNRSLVFFLENGKKAKTYKDKIGYIDHLLIKKGEGCPWIKKCRELVEKGETDQIHICLHRRVINKGCLTGFQE